MDAFADSIDNVAPACGETGLSSSSTPDSPCTRRRRYRTPSSGCIEHLSVAVGPLVNASSRFDVEVDARRGAAGAGVHDGRFVAGHSADPVHAVTAEVHERAAAQGFDVAQFARGVGQVGVEHGLDVADPADLAFAQRRQRALEQRVVAVVEAFDEMASGGARRGHHLRGILRVVGEWLLHQHVFAAGERGRAPLEMRRRRQRQRKPGRCRRGRRARHNYRGPGESSAARRSPAARSRSREAMATTSAPSSALAGVTMPRGAIRAAPNMPMRIMGGESRMTARHCGTLSLRRRDREQM